MCHCFCGGVGVFQAGLRGLETHHTHTRLPCLALPHRTAPQAPGELISLLIQQNSPPRAFHVPHSALLPPYCRPPFSNARLAWQGILCHVHCWLPCQS